ncbi:MAG: SRPBCC family protein [Actinomycetota bacterium]|nr:SRPBCC family protein [Actinomycetota bacterium]
MKVTTVGVLGAPPERVWNVLTDWERQASWMPDVAWIRVIGPERGLNARLAVRTKVLGLAIFTDRLQVVVWEPPRRVVVRHVGLVRGVGEWRLDRHAKGTWFRWTEDVSLNVPVVGDLAVLVYRPILRWALRRSLVNLRRRVEKRP